MKTVWIDIVHISQSNFFNNIIKLLSKRYSILITVLDRGSLPIIIKHDLYNVNNLTIKIIGKHKGTKASAIINANILRFFKLLLFIPGKSIDFSISHGYFGALFGRIFGFKSVTFDDDPNTLDYYFKKILSHKNYYTLYPTILFKNTRKTHYIPALKEWAYLNPDYFSPNMDILSHLNLSPKQYIFVREVITGSINYRSQEEEKILKISNFIPKDQKVILSLEDKSKKDDYPKNWILLEEPIKDIYSLIHYSKLLISSGDSMVREAALIGVKSIYIGDRDMPANKELIKRGLLVKVNVEDFNDKLFKEISSSKPQKINFQKEFIDVNKFMMKIINKILR